MPREEVNSNNNKFFLGIKIDNNYIILFNPYYTKAHEIVNYRLYTNIKINTYTNFWLIMVSDNKITNNFTLSSIIFSDFSFYSPV